MSGENRYPYLHGNRFVVPDSIRQVSSPYDQDSRLWEDLVQRGIRPVSVRTINLEVAGQLSIDETGYHFVIYGHDGSLIKTVNTQAFVGVQINTKIDRQDQVAFPAKHARGYSGPFNGLFITWPAQVGVYADLLIFKSFERPWIDGESAT